jgi:hypothetical protein
MSHKDEILELLDDIKPKALCDDCLSTELNIHPRQSVNIACRSLNASKTVTRIKTECDRCGAVKITNGFVSKAPPKVVARRLAEPMPSTQPHLNANLLMDIERARTAVVRVCRTLWQEKKIGEPPRSLAMLINQLRNEGILPNHEANMMLTLCNLRNVHVYEGLELQARELSIAVHANAIVSEWWATRSGGARKTIKGS